MSEPEKKPRRRVKKVKGHGGHHGGAWKVAYADFVTAMMALFLVLWLVSQADTKLKQAIAQYFRSPGVFDTQRGGILDGPKKVSKDPSELTSKEEEQALSSVAMSLKKEFNTRPEFSSVKDQIKIDMTDQGLRIQIVDQADRVSFTSGSAALAAEAKKVLAEIAQGVCKLPNPLQIGGHTDRRLFPPGSVYTNWELSTDRANAARRELEANCVKPEAIRHVVGHADTELLIPSDPFAPANRRISITVMRVAAPQPEQKDEDERIVEDADEEEEESPKTSSAKKRGDAAEEEDEAEESEPKSGAKKKSAAKSDAEDADAEEEKPATSKPAAATTPKAKPRPQGAVSVGEADALPSHAVRRREGAPKSGGHE